MGIYNYPLFLYYNYTNGDLYHWWLLYPYWYSSISIRQGFPNESATQRAPVRFSEETLVVELEPGICHSNVVDIKNIKYEIMYTVSIIAYIHMIYYYYIIL